MFKAEEAVIARERVQLPSVEYCDNYRCLQMLEDTPSGIFHLLDTCCRVHATPASFCLQASLSPPLLTSPLLSLTSPLPTCHLLTLPPLLPLYNRCTKFTSPTASSSSPR